MSDQPAHPAALPRSPGTHARRVADEQRELLIVGDRTTLAVCARRYELGEQLLQLNPCVQRARLAQAADDEELLEATLIDVAVAAIQTAARIRASRPHLTGEA